VKQQTTSLSQQFIEFAIAQGVLQFGEFTLKSGRASPYFFNMGNICNGASLDRLGEFYAGRIDQITTPVELLFGPAYKGIPLVSAASIALSRNHQTDLPYVFNRKEAKAILKFYNIRSLIELVMSSAPLFLTGAAFYLYILGGNEISDSKAYTLLAIFNILLIPLKMVVMTIMTYINAMISYGRIK